MSAIQEYQDKIGIGQPSDGVVNLIADTARFQEGLAFPNQHNLLTNGGMEIWQRGTGPFTTELAFTADEWQIAVANNGATGSLSVSKDTVTRMPNGTASMKVVATVTTGEPIIQQFIENWKDYSGKTVTLSMAVQAFTPNAVRLWGWDDNGFTFGSFHTGDGTWQVLTVTKTFMTGGTSGFWVGIGFDVSTTANLDNGMMVFGSVAADYAPLPIAEEWERCQRYYWRSMYGDDGTALGQWATFDQEGYSPGAGDNICVTLTYPVKLANNPIFTIAGTWNVVNCGQPAFNFATTTAFGIFAATVGAGWVKWFNDVAGAGVTADAN